jgi:fatty acid/phospholipid biosynthesis enzyme
VIGAIQGVVRVAKNDVLPAQNVQLDAGASDTAKATQGSEWSRMAAAPRYDVTRFASERYFLKI